MPFILQNYRNFTYNYKINLLCPLLNISISLVNICISVWSRKFFSRSLETSSTCWNKDKITLINMICIDYSKMKKTDCLRQVSQFYTENDTKTLDLRQKKIQISQQISSPTIFLSNICLQKLQAFLIKGRQPRK